jgi:hypothetical protein
MSTNPSVERPTTWDLADAGSWEEWEEQCVRDAQQVVAEWREATQLESPWQRMVQAFPFEGDAPGARPDVDARARHLVEQLRACEALQTQLAAQQASALSELRSIRLVQQAAEHPHENGACPSACCDEDGWVASELAMALGLTEQQAHTRLELASRLVRYPGVAAVMHSGRVQAWTATRLLEQLDMLGQYATPEQVDEVQRRTVEWLLAARRTVTQVNARLRRLILAARAAARREADGDVPDVGHARRRVSVTPSGTPGLAELVALLPEADALAVKATLHALAHDPVDADDPRSVDQRRADLLVTLVTGGVALHGRAADAQCALRDAVEVAVRMDVTVPAESLGGGDVPAWVPGYGDVPAGTARALAQTCELRPLVYEAGTGRLLGFGSTPVRMTWLSQLRAGRGYQHSASLETAVRLRDGTCRAPGCRRAAARCDCDHVVPYPAGETSLANSCSLCRRHHRLKTHAPGWAMSMAETGEVIWTTPTRERLVTYLDDLRPPALPPPAPPASAALIDPSQSDDPPF